MISQKVTLINEQGFHMRPAGIFAEAMNKYICDVKIIFNDKEYNGKSIMSIVSSCIKCGFEIEIVCSGVDEKAAVKEAVSLIENCFGE